MNDIRRKILMYKVKAENLITKEIETYAVLEETEEKAKTLFEEEFLFHRVKSVAAMDSKILQLK